MNHDMNNEQRRKEGQTSTEKEIRENILSPSQWVRILLMIGFGILSWLLRFAQVVITVIQILFALLTGRPNTNMARAGTLLALYQAQIWFYLSYSSDQRPYPFNDLPDSGDDLDDSMKEELNDDDGGDGRGGNTASPSGSSSGNPGERDDVFSDMSFTGSGDQDRRSDDDVPTLGEDTPAERRRDEDGHP